MIHNENEPATTVWELWNSDKAGPGMNSRNHIMFGSISSWFYKYLVGIRPTKSGYSDVSIKPVGQSILDHAAAKVETPHGDVESIWKLSRTSASCTYRHILSLPSGTNATVVIPFEFCSVNQSSKPLDQIVVTESGFAVWEDGMFRSGVVGIVSGKQVPDGLEFRLWSGDYEFVAAISTGHAAVDRQRKSRM